MAKDVLVLETIEVWSKVGVYEGEKRNGQPLEIDCRMYLDLENAMRTDALSQTVHYGEVCMLLKSVAEKTKADLLEALAGEMFEAVFAKYSQIDTLRLKIRKTNPPIEATLKSAGISMMRSREQWLAYKGVPFALSMGSNLGNCKEHLAHAVQGLRDAAGISGLEFSSVYETDPYGKTDQPNFMNLAVTGVTTLKPKELLGLCQRFENERGRQRVEHWGERTLDVDILYYGDVQMNEADLTLPHPEMHKRDFVLIPLNEIKSGTLEPSQAVRYLGSIAILEEA